MTKCQTCGAKSTLWLCNSHISELKLILTELPWWLARLEESAVGDVRLSTPTRRTSSAPKHLNGDATLAECIGEFPNERETDLAKAREQRANVALRRLAATGGVNMRASELVDAVRNTVTTWARHLSESRGMAFVRPTFIGPLLAGHMRLATDTPSLLAFLAEHVVAIASDEAAGECFHEFRDTTKRIVRTINPPESQRDLGPCPKPLEEGSTCDFWLTSHREAIDVTCPQCKTTYNIDRLMSDFMKRADHMPWSQEMIIHILEINGDHLSARTWRHWRSSNAIKPCAYMRADGRRTGITRSSADDVPLYRLSDVRARMRQNLKAVAQ